MYSVGTYCTPARHSEYLVLHRGTSLQINLIDLGRGPRLSPKEPGFHTDLAVISRHADK